MKSPFTVPPATPLPAEAYAVVCSYCKTHIRGKQGSEHVSHGCCKPCLREQQNIILAQTAQLIPAA